MSFTRFFATLSVCLSTGVSSVVAQEVHVIGVYQGTTPTSDAYKAAVEKHVADCDAHPERCDWGGGWDEIHKRFPSTSLVKVTRTGSPITLVLTAYGRTTWNIESAPGVVINKIILSGYEPQRLARSAATKGARIVQAQNYAHRRSPYFFFYGDDRNSAVGFAHLEGDTHVCSEADVVDGMHDASMFQRTLNALKRRRLTPTSIQSDYETPAEGITIDASSTSTIIPEIRESGLCYRNPDGTLSAGGN